MAASMEWTQAAIARLGTLWTEGISTAAIGVRMGISKNAVVGKAHRLNLPARPSPIRMRTDRPVRERVPRIAIQLTTYAPPPSVSKPVLEIVAPPAYPVTPTRERPSLTLIVGRPLLDSETCCWPIGVPGDSGFSFCGEPSARRRPYCDEHCGLAYVAKPGPRRPVAEDADVRA